jgi:serine phosphatase RsbU (regulator of sigma subunit)
MGMLRSAYSAAVRIADGPNGALEALGLYARAHEAALASTTFACQLFQRSRLLTYSNAGHPPPLLLRGDGTHVFLDQATDPPLGVRWEHVPRPQATIDFACGDTLVLYTDGLIERRGESLDAGLDRLVAVATPRSELAPAELADEIVRRLANPAGAQDDVCLLVARL